MLPLGSISLPMRLNSGYNNNGTFRPILAINVFKQHKIGKKCTKNAYKYQNNGVILALELPQKAFIFSPN